MTSRLEKRTYVKLAHLNLSFGESMTQIKISQGVFLPSNAAIVIGVLKQFIESAGDPTINVFEHVVS